MEPSDLFQLSEVPSLLTLRHVWFHGRTTHEKHIYTSCMGSWVSLLKPVLKSGSSGGRTSFNLYPCLFFCIVPLRPQVSDGVIHVHTSSQRTRMLSPVSLHRNCSSTMTLGTCSTSRCGRVYRPDGEYVNCAWDP